MRPGHCFRLCSKQDFDALPDTTVPEVQRSELAGAMLQLKTLGIDNLHKFEWLSPPPAEAMIRALELLHALGALDDDAKWAPPAPHPHRSRLGLPALALRGCPGAHSWLHVPVAG